LALTDGPKKKQCVSAGIIIQASLSREPARFCRNKTGAIMMVRIKRDLCEACGICGDVCPRHIPVTIEENHRKTTIISAERIDLCMECGHCVAVCPNRAMKVGDLAEEEFTPVKETDVSEGVFLSLLRQRRSIRRYKDRPVPREIIDRIINAAHSAPTGTGRMTTGIIVIDDPEILGRLSEHIYRAYEKLGGDLKHPIARFFIRRRMGEKKFRTLRDFVMPGMQWYIRWHKEGRSNEILRDCPVLLLFHSPIYEPVGSENCIIAAWHAVMMAQVMNIGTCLNSLIPPMCNRVPEIKSLLGLADNREVYASITMGYPKYKFKRAIPRKLAGVHYLS
jgi:nitroreductase/NAD-dependent dihydropyrimidine dehydrogenase PreA subunit